MAPCAGEDESRLSAAIARQRALIEAWAYELVREYKTGRRSEASLCPGFGEGLATRRRPQRMPDGPTSPHPDAHPPSCRLLVRGEGAPPIKLAWAPKPNKWKKLIDPTYAGEMNEVPLPPDPTLDHGPWPKRRPKPTFATL